MNTKLTCRSCSFWTRQCCGLGIIFWPEGGPDCFSFEYEPGSDEKEDIQMRNEMKEAKQNEL